MSGCNSNERLRTQNEVDDDAGTARPHAPAAESDRRNSDNRWLHPETLEQERNHFVLDCSTGLIGTLERVRNADDRMDARLFQDGQEWKLELVRGIRIVLTQDNFNPRVY